MPSCHLQVDGLQLSSSGRGVNNGAWGVWLKNGADTLVKDFNAQARMVRDVAVQGLQPGTVIVNSKSLRLTQGACMLEQVWCKSAGRAGWGSAGHSMRRHPLPGATALVAPQLWVSGVICATCNQDELFVCVCVCRHGHRPCHSDHGCWAVWSAAEQRERGLWQPAMGPDGHDTVSLKLHDRMEHERPSQGGWLPGWLRWREPLLSRQLVRSCLHNCLHMQGIECPACADLLNNFAHADTAACPCSCVERASWVPAVAACRSGAPISCRLKSSDACAPELTGVLFPVFPLPLCRSCLCPTPCTRPL